MTETAPSSPAASTGSAGSAAVAAIVGLLFLMLGWSFGQWLASPSGNPYAIQWSEGPLAGQPVAYFDLTGGTAWRDLGEFGTGVVLLLEAGLYLLLTVRPMGERPVTAAILALALAGCLLNVLAAAMQIRAGFTQPLLALLGLAVCVASAFSAWPRFQRAQ